MNKEHCAEFVIHVAVFCVCLGHKNRASRTQNRKQYSTTPPQSPSIETPANCTQQLELLS